MKWRCRDCGNRTVAENKPRVCENPDCGHEGTYVIDEEVVATETTVRGWKCRNCGNTIDGPFAPSICPVCNAHDSYQPIA